MTLWYASDHHFGHENIIQFCNRPFKNAAEMDEVLITNHNALVQPEDHVWFLGDLTMARGSLKSGQAKWLISLIKRMNGHKRLILGNHDLFPTKVYLEAGFEKIKASHRHDNILFTHIPIHPASLSNVRACVHGHIHNNQSTEFKPILKLDKKTQVVSWTPYINISVEVTDYKPVDLDWVKAKIGTST